MNFLDVFRHLFEAMVVEDPEATVLLRLQTAGVWDGVVLTQPRILLPHHVAKIERRLSSAATVVLCT